MLLSKSKRETRFQLVARLRRTIFALPGRIIRGAAASPAKLALAKVDKIIAAVRCITFFIGNLQKFNIKIKFYLPASG